MEQFDVLDCTGRKTGALIERDRAHATGTWHGSFHCLITYPRKGRPVVLFQRRSLEKKIAPGAYDVSVGGHYSAGEGPELAGPREISEELGLNVSFASLLPLGKRIFVHCFTQSVQEYEFQDVFLLPLDRPPTDLALQPGEVDGALEMDVEDGLRLFSRSISALDCAVLEPDGTRKRALVREVDFVPCLDRYYLKLLQIVARHARGERSGLAI